MGKQVHWCITVAQGYIRSSKLTPIKARMLLPSSFPLHLCVYHYHFQDIMIHWSKTENFLYCSASHCPHSSGPNWNFALIYTCGKTRITGLPDIKKFLGYIEALSLNTLVRQTDRLTDLVEHRCTLY